MDINGNNTVDAGHLEHQGDVSSGDRHTFGHLAVLPRIAIVGMIAVILAADARFIVRTNKNSSMMLSLTLCSFVGEFDWIMNTFLLRTLSSILMRISPSLNLPTIASPSGTLRYSATSFANGRLPFPRKR